MMNTWRITAENSVKTDKHTPTHMHIYTDTRSGQRQSILGYLIPAVNNFSSDPWLPPAAFHWAKQSLGPNTQT